MWITFRAYWGDVDVDNVDNRENEHSFCEICWSYHKKPCYVILKNEFFVKNRGTG